jgi:hypothetical protein
VWFHPTKVLFTKVCVKGRVAHNAEPSGEQVREQEQQQGNISHRPEYQQSCRAWPLPVRLGINGQYMPVHPEVFGQKWNLQLSVTLAIPKLIKGNLFDF